jgi:RNA-binding protein Nova
MESEKVRIVYIISLFLDFLHHLTKMALLTSHGISCFVHNDQNEKLVKKNVVESPKPIQKNSDTSECQNKVNDGGKENVGEEKSINTPTSTAQRQHSPIAETLATIESGSGTSSPTHSTIATLAGTVGQEDHDHQIDEIDPSSNTEDDAKASWDSGILDLSSSSFITIKLLLSNNMAGSIIGRAGETISELQHQSSSRIKLGQSGDYYPGTSERACLVHGTLENVKKAATLLLQKLYDLQSEQAENQLSNNAGNANDLDTSVDANNYTESDAMKDDQLSTSRSLPFSFRFLIPSTSCGMLIGRNGLNIKKMKETSQVTSIRLTSKEPEQSRSNMHFSSESMAIAATSERVLTITGNETDSCISCAFLILEGFARHPDICRYVNNTTSYLKINSSFHDHYGSNRMNFHARQSGGRVTPGRGARTNQNFAGSRHNQNIHQRSQERTPDSRILSHKSSTDERRNQQQMYRNGPIGGQQMRSSPHMQSPSAYGTLPDNPRDPQQPVQSTKISVSDAMVGAILGKRGQTLTYLERQSGAKIKISQRGEFIPGTTNRVVTISGPTDQSIVTAKSLIRQQLARNTHHTERIISSLPEEAP